MQTILVSAKAIGAVLRDMRKQQGLTQKELGRRVGLDPVAQVRMESFAGRKALVVTRFDRRWSSDSSWLIRLPQEDMCQGSGISGNLKYESEGGPGMAGITDILFGSLESFTDRNLFMKTQLLFWMLGAIDGHAKNFSIFHLAAPHTSLIFGGLVAARDCLHRNSSILRGV